MCSIYHSPSSNESYLTGLCHQLEFIRNNYSNCALWIAGDVNLPDIDWPNNTIQSHLYTCSLNQIFLDFLHTNALIQMVDFPTRGPNILDIFITNRSSLVEECNVVDGISDHEAIIVTSSVIAQLSHPPKRSIYLWTQADFSLVRHKAQSLCEEYIITYTSSTPVDILWNSFFNDL